MATGDSHDIAVQRVEVVLPRRWWQFVAPTKAAVIGGLSDATAWCYNWITYARLQTRMSTITAPWLDLASYDFLGRTTPRRPPETDLAFSARVIKEVLRPRQTRAAILKMLLDLTGNAGKLQEPWNPRDWGCYGDGQGGYGYTGYGSLSFRNQILVQAVRPSGAGIPNVAGYGSYYSAYGAVGALSMWADIGQVVGPVTDAEIYARVAATIAAGTTAWVDITSSSATIGSGVLAWQAPQNFAFGAFFGNYW